MFEYYTKNKNKIDEIAYIILFLLGIYVFFKYIFHFVAPFVFAYALSFLLYPLAIFLDKKFKIGKSFSSLLCCIIFIGIIIFFSKTILSRIILEGKYFLTNIPFYTKEFIIKIEMLKIKYNHILYIIPENFRENVLVYTQKNLTDFINKILRSSSSSIVKFVPQLFLNTIVMMIATFFFVRDKILIQKFFCRAIPKKILITLSQLKKGCLQGISAYVKAELIMMSTTGIICTIGFCIIKYPYALFLGLMTALIDALPVLGTGCIIWPWTAYCFLNGNYNRAIILLLTYLTVTVTRHILSPKLISKQIGVHPLVMLSAIYIGLKTFGVFGMILGPIIIITGKIILKESQNLNLY
jgi:sporulation integral membrane protein YtvI